MRLGYHLSSEEHAGPELVDLAVEAERSGFAFASISDHFHPWLDVQGESPFVWSVLGAIARDTTDIELITAVTCPTIRNHPAIVAQAAATTATMMPDRFSLGLGSGENLNEHIVGARWPAPRERLDMLEEAVVVIRRLFSGDLVVHRGNHFHVEDARLYSLPDQPPPIVLSAAGPVAAGLAGRVADGLMLDRPDGELVERFRSEGEDEDRRVYGKLMVCWDTDLETARRTALEWWPVGGVGTAGADLRLPSDFASLAENLDQDAALAAVVVTDQIDDVADAAQRFSDAGITDLSLHQVGPRQSDFLQSAARLVGRAATGGRDERPAYTPQGRSDPVGEEPVRGPRTRPRVAWSLPVAVSASDVLALADRPEREGRVPTARPGQDAGRSGHVPWDVCRGRCRCRQLAPAIASSMR